MSIVKTAISMPKALFEEADAAARELKVSRSRLIVLALKDFLRQRENDRLLAQANEAFAGGLDAEDEAFLKFASANLADRLKDDVW